MAQHDLNIANQGFPAFRSDLNNALSAIQTTHSGTTRPTGAVAGQIWLDTTSATSPTLKYYDGADDISLATIDHSANTVNWLDSNVSVTGLTTTATGTVITLSDTANTSTVNLIIDNQKQIRFRETTANGTNYVALQAPASVSADLTFTLPATDGTNGQALITDGSGNLSFSTISTSLATPLAVVGNATAGSEIRLPEDTDNGSNYVALKAPNTIASNLTLTLPSADGSSGQVLQTNGSGVLSFAGVSASAGQVIQVVQTIKTDAFSTSSGSMVDITGFSVSITPSSASNKVLVLVSAGILSSSTGGGSFINLLRDATVITSNTSGGQADTNDAWNVGGGGGMSSGNDDRKYSSPSITFLDSPSSTSSLTYKCQLMSNSGTVYFNRWALNTDHASVSSITLMEIKG